MCLIGANLGCKTRLVRPHVQDEFDDRYIRTLGAKVSKKHLSAKETPVPTPVTMDLMIWDILSARHFRRLLSEAYCHGTRGILAVIDMTRRSTLEEAGAWIAEVENLTGPVPVVVVGANRDQTERQQVTEEEARHLAEAHGATCFFPSRSSEDSVEQAFQQLADRIVARFVLQPRIDDAGPPR